MKIKTLVVLVVVLAALSAAAYYLTRLPASPAGADPRVGQPVVDRPTIEKAAQLRLTGNGTTVLLTKQPDASWRITNDYDLPADFDKLSLFVSDLANAKVQRFVTANPERLARLEFTDRRIALLDAAGHELWSLAVGKNADGGGCFVRFGAEPNAYLASLNTWTDPVAKNWADSTLLKLKSADIAKAEIGFASAPPVVISRAKTGDSFSAAGRPAGRLLATDKINSLLDQLSTLRFSDLSDPADPNAAAAKQHSRTFKLTTFAGQTYVLTLGRKPEEKSNQAATPPAAKSQVAATKTVPAGPVYVFITCSDAAAPINALMKKRAFEVYESAYTGLPGTPDDLFVAAPPPAAKTPAKS